METISEQELEGALTDMFTDACEVDADDDQEITLPDELVGKVADVRSYEQSGVLTNNRGLVVTMKDGGEFQITIVRSR